MAHVIREPGVLNGTRMAAFLALVHAVNDVRDRVRLRFHDCR